MNMIIIEFKEGANEKGLTHLSKVWRALLRLPNVWSKKNIIK